MARFALLDIADAVLRIDEHNVKPDDLPNKNWRWLPVVDVDPPFDAETEIKTGPVVTVNTTDVTRTWTVTAKKASQIDAEKTAAATGEADAKIVKAVVLWLVDELNALGAAVTPAQARDKIIAKYKTL